MVESCRVMPDTCTCLCGRSDERRRWFGRSAAARARQSFCIYVVREVLWSPSYFAASVGYVSGRRCAATSARGMRWLMDGLCVSVAPTARQHVALAACVDAHRSCPRRCGRRAWSRGARFLRVSAGRSARHVRSACSSLAAATLRRLQAFGSSGASMWGEAGYPGSGRPGSIRSVAQGW